MITSTSTQMPRGSSVTPIAVREWRPASPNTSTMRSEKPSSTSACWSKPGALFTIPNAFTIWRTRFRLPSAFRTVDRTARPTRRAASYPSSRVSSRPTFPVTRPPSGRDGPCPETYRTLPTCLARTKLADAGRGGSRSIPRSRRRRSAFIQESACRGSRHDRGRLLDPGADQNLRRRIKAVRTNEPLEFALDLRPRLLAQHRRELPQQLSERKRRLLRVLHGCCRRREPASSSNSVYGDAVKSGLRKGRAQNARVAESELAEWLRR